MNRLIATLLLLILVACGRRQVVTDTAQSSTGMPNAATTDTSSTITPGTTSAAPTATETVAPAPPANVETAPGMPSATKKTAPPKPAPPH